MDTRPDVESTGAVGVGFVHEIRVTWGDCDPARIVYTARIPWFALDAINAWWEHHLGGPGWYYLEIDRNIGTPFVHISLDFTAPITPRHRLLCDVRLMRLGETSIEFQVDGSQDGTRCFRGRFVCVFAVADKFVKQPIPGDIRALVQPLLPDGAA